ncbi:MAG: hypothetical protein J5545_04155 [Bacteroidaceae bacterium]|nr:hypothetical protein [Bacteroidaceae bacterium]
MKRLPFLLAAVLWVIPLLADNKTSTVEQVTEAISLDDDVDLHITSTTPFTADGAIDITNVEHAVIIFDNLKPSLAAKQLKFITIDGKAAKDGTNCQFRIYDRGAILFPYGKEGTSKTSFHPLAVYSEQNCLGDTCELFGLENSGGYMNTLTAAKLNKRIRSFRLKRGYMVTFSTMANGYGYSRCFIADKADLIFNTLPAILDKRIASYRVFRWQNTSKVGVADYLDATALSKLNAQSSFTWGVGKNMLPDVEVVPHHIKENWPGPAECGSVTYSPHLKTNNEPRNTADDSPCELKDILANWPDLMRTGLRLCTPSSWDGSDYWNATGFLADFLNEIDKRGWRCDIIDLHGYWNEGSFTTNVNNWAQKFKRPVWITEWVWGSSWGPAGIFSEASSRDNPTAADLQKNKTVVSRILDNLNGNNACERYFYWNGEANCSKIMRDGKLTPAGEYFATMKTNGPGYTGYGNYVPKAPPMEAPSDLTVSFARRTNTVTLKWKNNNNGLTDLAIIQQKVNNRWVNIDTLISDASTPSINIHLEAENARGYQIFRVSDIDYDGKTRNSAEAAFFNGEAQTIADLMVGTIQLDNESANPIYFDAQEQIPAVFVGMTSNKNTANGIVNHIRSIGKSSFNYNLEPWTLGKSMTITTAETADYIVVQPGIYSWGDLTAIVDTCIYVNSIGKPDSKSSGDTIEVNFRQPFAEGTKPVVLVQNITAQTGLPTSVKVFDITNIGFKMKLVKQTTATTAIREQQCMYFAITPGKAKLSDTGYSIYAGHCDALTGGTANVNNYFTDAQGDTLLFRQPFILAAGQTHNLDYPSVFRKAADITVNQENGDGVTETFICGIKVRRQVDPTATIPTGLNAASKTGDLIGWVVIDIDAGQTGISAFEGDTSTLPYSIQNGTFTTYNSSVRAFTLDGVQIRSGAVLKPGLYIIYDGKKSKKLLVK